MWQFAWPEPVRPIMEQGRIGADDVLTLRRTVFGDGIVSDREAELLFSLNEACTEWDRAWPEFFVEALTDYLVHQAQPEGHISEANAEWLIGRISHDGRVDTACELELLVSLLEKAQSCPPRLVAFALEQVKAGVLSGDGPTRAGVALKPGVIGEAEVDLLRRILYAYGGHGNIAISQAEAEILFDINDATIEAENHPSWSDLFVKAIANFLMHASGYRVPSREEALRRAEWLDSTEPNVPGFLGRMLSGGLKGILDAYRHDPETEMEKRLAAREAEMRLAERVTESEALWLAERIGRDGVLHENERALIRFIRDESPHIHPALQPLLQSAA